VTAAPRGLFVTGTDTGVGKTFVSCLLLAGLRARGLRAAGLKPVETGVGPDGPQDAQALRRASGARLPLAAHCPLALPLPAAPEVAAAAAGVAIDLGALDAAHAALAARHDFVLVEGAGGIRVPLGAGLDMADLAARWRLPLLVVARAALGTVNHTLLTLREAEARGLAVAGVVISHAAPISEADAANLGALRTRLGPQLVGEIPPLRPGAEAPPDALALDRILAAATPTP